MTDALELIKERQSSRALFDLARPVAKEDLRRILEAGSWAPTAHNMQNFEVVVVSDKKLLEAIGDIQAPLSEVFVRENCAQLSASEEELKRKKTGLLATMFPPFMRTPGGKPSAADAGERSGMSLGKAIRSSPVLLVVLYDTSKRAPASEGDFLGIMSLGCVMENMWLMAQSLGIGLHIVSSLGSEPIVNEVKKILGIPDHLRIAFSCRLGYPAAGPVKYLRVRRDVEDFAHQNRYGTLGSR